MANTILLKTNNEWERREADAGAAILPGELLEHALDGDLQPHSVAGGNTSRMFAIENELVGKGITDSYSSGDRVLFVRAQPGDVVLARLKASQGQIRLGRPLESDGNGELQSFGQAADSRSTESIVAFMAETVSNSASIQTVKVEVA